MMDKDKRIAELEAERDAALKQVAALREWYDLAVHRGFSTVKHRSRTAALIVKPQEAADAYEQGIRLDERRKVLEQFKRICVKTHDAIPTSGTSEPRYYDGIEAAMMSIIDGIDAELAALSTDADAKADSAGEGEQGGEG